MKFLVVVSPPSIYHNWNLKGNGWNRKIYLQYPSNTPKYTTSEPYWMQNNLLLYIPFFIHNNLKMIINKIFSSIYLSLTVLFTFVPLHGDHESWVHKTRKLSMIRGENESTSNRRFSKTIRPLRTILKLNKVICVCIEGVILADWSGKQKFNTQRCYICSSKIWFFETPCLR